jgi:hypothetical protein
MADSQGATSSAAVTITVQGAADAPAAALSGNATLAEGSAFSASGSFNDVDVGDTWTATVDYGDGSGLKPLALSVEDVCTGACLHRQRQLYGNCGRP